MTAQIRVAVVGAGYFGRFHARHFARHPGCDLVGIVDVDGARARAVASEVGTAAFTGLDALPDAIHAASVATPTVTHGAVAGVLLARGVHVLLEKPVAASSEEGFRLSAAAAKTGALVQVGHIERFSATYRALRPLVPAPSFLQARRMCRPSGRATDVDVVLDLMIHDIDLVMDLVPAPVTEVHAVGATLCNASTDVCQARIAFANGAVADLTASRVAEAPERSLRVYGATGFAVADFLAKKVMKIHNGAGRVNEPEVLPVPVADEDSLGNEIDAFLTAIRDRSRPLVTLEEGASVLAVAERISHAAAVHQRFFDVARSA